eukprot:g12633.t1
MLMLTGLAAPVADSILLVTDFAWLVRKKIRAGLKSLQQLKEAMKNKEILEKEMQELRQVATADWGSQLEASSGIAFDLDTAETDPVDEAVSHALAAVAWDCIKYFVSPPAFLEDTAEESRGKIHLAGLVAEIAQE